MTLLCVVWLLGLHLLVQHESIYVPLFCHLRKPRGLSLLVCLSCTHYFLSWPGAVARSEVYSLCMQAAPSSIPTSGTFFRGDLVMETFLRPFSLFRWFRKSSCQLLAKGCALSIGKLEPCGLVNWLCPKWHKMCWRAVKQKSNQNFLSFFSSSWCPGLTAACECSTSMSFPFTL